MAMRDYPPPLDELLRLGEPVEGEDWPDYLQKGFGPEHVPDLLRMAGDDELHDADTETPLVWAPLHAWRTLGQLRAAEAAGELVDLFDRLADEPDDWLYDEVPEVLGMIGPAA